MHNRQNSYFIYGKYSVISALNNPKRKILEAFCIKEFFENKELKKYISASPFQETSRATLDKMLGTNCVHQGIAIKTLPLTIKDIKSIDLDTEQTILILDQIADHHNFGAILRSAVTFNVQNVIIASTNCAHENSSLAKASSGALELVNIIEVVNISQTMEWLKKNGFWIMGLDHNAQMHLHQYQSPTKLAIVLGNEASGMRKLTRQKCDTIVKIPIIQNQMLDSLNASTACAIALYEIFKQKNFMQIKP